MPAVQEAKWELEEQCPIVRSDKRGNGDPHSVQGEPSIHRDQEQTGDNHYAKYGLRIYKRGVPIGATASIQISAGTKIQVVESVHVVENQQAS